MRGTVLLLLGVVIGINISSSNANRMCYNCNGAASPADCDRITKCGSNQECYEEIVTTNNILYNSGCRSKLVCATSRERQIGRKSSGNLVACSRCCDTDFCNVGLCGGRTPPRGLRCLSCDYLIMHAKDCEHIAMCGEDQMCYAHRIMNNAGIELQYETGCMPKLQCQGIVNARYIQQCLECCDTPFCNMYKCGQNWTEVFHTSTQPSITPTSTVHAFISGTTSLPYHGNGSLMCTSNAPDVSYVWTFNDTQISGEHNSTLYIHDMTEAKEGTYSCTVIKYDASVEAKANVTITAVAAAVHSVSSSPRPAHTDKELNIFCEVNGFPVPEIHWSFTNSQGFSFVPRDVNILLYGIAHIQSFKPGSHSGNWTCFARNKLGTSSLGIVIN